MYLGTTTGSTYSSKYESVIGVEYTVWEGMRRLKTEKIDKSEILIRDENDGVNHEM